MSVARLSSRVRDAAVVLPLVGLFLLMPPTIALFAVGYPIAGVPLIVAYLFGVWIALIACAALIAHRLARSERDAGGEGGRDAGSEGGERPGDAE